MGMLTVLGGSSACVATAIYFLRRRISKNWLTPSSITHPITLTKEHTVIITGGNSGLGYETALDLAKRGAPIVLGCRDAVSAERAVKSIRAASNNEDVSFMELDLSSLQSVKTFANDIIDKHKNVYALICNAGVWMSMDQEKRTQDGYEIHFGVNHLGHFMLIQELLPLLEKSEMDSRIVLVSSSLSKSGKIDMQTKDFMKKGRQQPEKSFAPSGYCDSKLMNALTAGQLAKVLDDSTVSAYSVCPGFCKSQLGRNVKMSPVKQMIASPVMRLFQRSANQGAQNIVYLTVQDKGELVNGGFYQDGKASEEMLASHSDVQKPLWDLSVQLIKEI